MTGDPDDRALVSRFARERDEAAFRVLYRRHTPRLYALALRILGHRMTDAEDLVQEAWVRAAERLHQFRWESALRTWLAGIVVNCCREHLRGEWRWAPGDDGASAEQADAAAGPELTLDLDRAIVGLPPGCRAVFLLHDVEGRTHDEIAAMLDISPGTSKSQLFHARRHLRARLQPASPSS
jgi:RNA polymerase sigma-70 factor (ECF subfamily)